jgi:glycosyltransferase involved in cell wall biosynthesis
MPSKLEGFCLPVLEAMACGCPVVASSATAIPELVGPTGILFDPDDSNQLSDSLKQILSDPNARYQYKMSGIERASKYTWENTAKLTASVYSDLV